MHNSGLTDTVSLADGSHRRALRRHPYMGLQLYDIAGAERRFIAHCRRIKLALMHKGRLLTRKRI